MPPALPCVGTGQLPHRARRGRRGARCPGGQGSGYTPRGGNPLRAPRTPRCPPLRDRGRHPTGTAAASRTGGPHCVPGSGEEVRPSPYLLPGAGDGTRPPPPAASPPLLSVAARPRGSYRRAGATRRHRRRRGSSGSGSAPAAAAVAVGFENTRPPPPLALPPSLCPCAAPLPLPPPPLPQRRCWSRAARSSHWPRPAHVAPHRARDAGGQALPGTLQRSGGGWGGKGGGGNVTAPLRSPAQGRRARAARARAGSSLRCVRSSSSTCARRGRGITGSQSARGGNGGA